MTFESFVINLTETTLAAVILGFSTLSGTNPQIKTPNRYDEHPHHFSRGVNPLPLPRRHSCCVSS